MPIASITSLAVNKEEYSKFEEDNAIIEALTFATGTVTIAVGVTKLPAMPETSFCEG